MSENQFAWATQFLWSKDSVKALLYGVARYDRNFGLIKNDPEFSALLNDKSENECWDKWRSIRTGLNRSDNVLEPVLRDIYVPPGPLEIGATLGGPPEYRDWPIDKTIALEAAVKVHGPNWNHIKEHGSGFAHDFADFTVDQLETKWAYLQGARQAELAVKALELMQYVQETPEEEVMLPVEWEAYYPQHAPFPHFVPNVNALQQALPNVEGDELNHEAPIEIQDPAGPVEVDQVPIEIQEPVGPVEVHQAPIEIQEPVGPIEVHQEAEPDVKKESSSDDSVDESSDEEPAKPAAVKKAPSAEDSNSDDEDSSNESEDEKLAETEAPAAKDSNSDAEDSSSESEDEKPPIEVNKGSDEEMDRGDMGNNGSKRPIFSNEDESDKRQKKTETGNMDHLI